MRVRRDTGGKTGSAGPVRVAASRVQAAARLGVLLVSLPAWAGACKPSGSAQPPPDADAGATDRHEASSIGDPHGTFLQPGDPKLEGEAPRKRPEPQTVTDRDTALEAVKTGNPDGAAAFLSGFVVDHPDDIEARLALARAQAAVGAYEKANRTLAGGKPAPTKDPRSRELGRQVVAARAELLRVRGDRDAAILLLEGALKQDPDAFALQGDLLEMLVETGRRDDPRARTLMDRLYDAYEAGKAKNGAELMAVAQAALARGSKGAFHDANMVLEEAEAAAPADQGSWTADRILLLRGRMFLEKYATSEALTTFGLILQRDAWNPDALAGTASVHVDALQFAGASRVASEALQVNPEQPDAHAVLARVALIEGRREEARTRIRDHVFSVNPRHGAGLAVMAGLALAEQDIAGYAKWRDAALSLNPKNGTFYKDLSDILGFLHLYPEADRILREGAGKAPDDPYVHAALGLNLLRLGDETKALEELGLAWKKDPFNERTRNVLDLYEQSIAKNYALAERGGVTVRLPHDDREFLQPSLLDAVMQSRKTLDAAYKTSSGPLRLEFFREPQEFSVRTVGVPSLGAIAVCFGQVITFIGPYHGMHNIDNVIHHELAHVYAIKKSKGRVPRWFTEGLSEWESEQADPAWARESAELLQQARRAGKLRRLHELELAFIRAESSAMMEVAYSTAAYAIRYLGQTYGRDALVSMLVGYGSGESTDVLVEKHLGKNMATVESEFEQWFFAELDKVVTGWHPASHAKAADERDDLFKRAVRQLQHDDRPAAIHTLEELLARGGDGYASRMLLAQLLLDGPKPVAAQRHLQAAQKFHLEAIDPLVRLAELARKLDRPDDEKSHLRSALAIDGDSLEPAARLLMLAVVTGDRDASSFAFRRAQAIAPLHPIVLAAQALQVAKSDKARARTLFERGAKALSGPPRGPGDTYVVLALAAAAVGDAAAAKKFAAVARNDPRLPAAARKQLEKF